MSEELPKQLVEEATLPPEERTVKPDTSRECASMLRRIRIRPIEDGINRLPTTEEVLVIQYVRPNGKKRLCYAPCDDQELVKESRCMWISAEVDRIGTVIMYGRYVGDKEDNELITISENGPDVQNKLKELIKAVKQRGV